MDLGGKCGKLLEGRWRYHQQLVVRVPLYLLSSIHICKLAYGVNSSVASIAASNAAIASYAAPGGFNDFDMLVGTLGWVLVRNSADVMVGNRTRGAHNSRRARSLRSLGHLQIASYSWHGSYQNQCRLSCNYQEHS